MITDILYSYFPNFDYLDFEGEQDIHVLYLLIWGFGGGYG